MSGGGEARTPERVTKAEMDEFRQNAEEQLSLEAIAHLTGGEAIYNTNDLKGALAEVDRVGSHYYSLAYAPSNKSQDNKPRQIEIGVRPGKFHLSYRRSYTPSDDPQRNRISADFASLLQHDVPPSTQILFRVTPPWLRLNRIQRPPSSETTRIPSGPLLVFRSIGESTPTRGHHPAHHRL